MRLALIDAIPWDYTVATPGQQPLGGSQSALCYLALELAAQGDDVFVINQVKSAQVIQGVTHSPLKNLRANLLSSFDAVVLQNQLGLAAQLRQYLRDDAPLVLWTQHATDQPAMQELGDPKVASLFDAIAFVSDWQRAEYGERFQLDRRMGHVRRNAASPGTIASQPAVLDPARPVLVYTSTPFRGLNLLLETIFPAIHRELPQAELHVYSSMAVYRQAAERDAAAHGKLYELCRTTPGVHYHGSVPQGELAQALASAALLAYPNHFAETSCIAVMEALASGAQVVTSALGALPETTAGFAELIAVDDDWDRYCREFIAAALARLRSMQQAPEQAAARRDEQIAAVRSTCNWTQRAAEWQRFLGEQIAQRREQRA